MKVRELISELTNYDQDSPVFLVVKVIGMPPIIRTPIDLISWHNDRVEPSPRVEITGEDVLINAKLEIVKD